MHEFHASLSIGKTNLIEAINNEILWGKNSVLIESGLCSKIYLKE